MLCSPTELGLGDDAGGILVLPSDLPLGTPVFDALGVTSDVVFDLDLTRNRPDAYSHRGVARDVAAFTGVPFTDVTAACRAVGPSRHDAGRARRPRRLRTLHGHGAHGGRGEAVAHGGWPSGSHRAGHAADQQRRRRLQLRHARAGPAQPPVRPRPPARSRLPGAAGHGGRDHDHARRRQAHLHARRPADLRRRGHPHRHRRDHGRRLVGDPRRHDDGRPGDGVVRARRGRPDRRRASGCAPRPRLASSEVSTPT